MKTITNETPLKKTYCRFYLAVIVLFYLAGQWIFAFQVHAENQTNTDRTADKESHELLSSKIKRKIEKINERLKISISAETEQNAKQMGVTLAQLQERTAKLRSIKAIYERYLTALKREDSLKKEESILKETIEDEHWIGISQKPPYSLSLYDLFLNKLSTTSQKKENAELSLKLAEKMTQEAENKVDSAQKALRRIKEELETVKDEKVTLVLQLNLNQAEIEKEMAEANFDFHEITYQNLTKELHLVKLTRDIAQKQADWIKARLFFDQDDLEKHLENIKTQRAKFQKRIKALIREQQVVENTWLKAQKAYESVYEEDEASAALAEAFLKEREAWRETYQKVLEQTENMLQTLNKKEQIWQRRYNLLKENLDYEVLETWQEETKAHIASIERLIPLQQNFQTTLQSQIVAIQNQRSSNDFERKLKQYVDDRLKALEKLSERTLEYQSMLQGERELAQRFVAELGIKRAHFSLAKQLKAVGGKVQKIWEFELWVIDEHAVTVKKIFTAVIILIIGIILVKRIISAIRKRLLPRTKLDENAAVVIEKLLYYFALLFIALFALRTVNIPLTAFTFLGGAIAIGVGFGAQNLINNFISGFIIMMERPIKIGDIIEVEDSFGIIEEIGARRTRIRTAGNFHILVPNSSFLEKNVTNLTLSDQRIRAKISVGVVYGSDTNKVSQLMLRAAFEHPNVFKAPEPFVLFNDFGDNALLFEVYFWIRMTRLMERRIIKSDLRLRIEQLFKDAGIVIAFPQRDVHLDSQKPIEVRMLKSEDNGGTYD